MLDKLFIWVLNMSLIGSYVIVFVLTARLLLKKAPKIFSYALWGIVLFRLLCPFSFGSVLSLLPMAKTPIPQDIIYSTAPQISTGIAAFDNVVNPILPVPSNIGDSINPIQVWLFIGAVIWVLGMVTMVIYSAVAFIKLRQSLIGAAPLKENVYLADHISSPFVIGLFKPKIYLPSSLSDSEKDFITLHEMCHVRRFDHVTRILGFAALTVHWFNPLVWLAFIVSGKDMEMSCDEAVMKKMHTDIRTEYSQSLLQFGTTKRMIHATPLAFGEGDTKSRVKNVLNYKKPAFWVIVVSVIVLVAVGVGLMANPKDDEQDLSLLNPETIPKVAYQMETAIVVLSEDDTATTIPPKKIADFFSYQSFERESLDTLELIPSYQFDIGGTTVSLYQSKPGLIKLHNELSQYRYYTNSDIYDDFVTLMDSGEKVNALADFEAIEIGTKIEVIHERFGAPDSTLFGMHGDIYIVGDKQIIIYYGFEGENGYPVTEVKVDDYTPKTLTHDQAVAAALFSVGNRYLKGECISEGHIILGYDDSDKNETKIYALTTISWYGFENSNFVDVSGAAFPAVITLFSDNEVEIEEPLDGSDYTKSIEEMFPKEYHDKIFNYEDSARDNLKQQREKYASEYLAKIGREAKIGDYSDFDYTSLTKVGVSVETSNNLENFYKAHNYYPSFIGTRERLENGVRMVYEMSYIIDQGEISFTKYDYDTKQILEQFTADANTGNSVE